jgi:type IV pilus assembly protein PilV
MMLEAMVALLVFAIGILGLVAAQSATLKDASSARYRGMAAALASDLVSRMWMSDRQAATLQSSFASGAAGTGYASWLAQVQASGMPGVDEHPPEVSFETAAGGGSTASASSRATIKLHWQVPGDAHVHTYTMLAQLK